MSLIDKIVDEVTEPFDLQKHLKDLEEQAIKETLERFGDNKSKSAKFLGMNRTTFQEKCKKLGTGK